MICERQTKYERKYQGKKAAGKLEESFNKLRSEGDITLTLLEKYLVGLIVAERIIERD